MWEVMAASVIMHNMIVEQEHDDACINDQERQLQGKLVELEPEVSTLRVSFICTLSSLIATFTIVFGRI
jgi:hypothetical protein